MDDVIVQPLIQFLQQLSVETTSLILFLSSISSILILFKFFGKEGLYVHSIVAVIIANIQILKMVKFYYYPSPVALGTILFASTYICSGILVEHYGTKAAQYNIWYCFSAQILVTLFMIITIGHKPLASHLIIPENMLNLSYDKAMATIFTPLPRLLAASLVSFIFTQKLGIGIFNLVKMIMPQRYLWLRAMILVMVALIIDPIIFNLLAWKWLSNNPSNLKTIWDTYIVSTFITQGLITMLSTPILWLSYKIKAKSGQI